ncbi:hypothetical protein [Maricaulis sp.]|uniref:hypothetical protein n=1 Tax=Maricaulis sp. TaxID=1486257 RepID=UPI003A93A261|tara:strand:- start:5948 stop:6376 length:429 start_codon:yes stop_codon:yes gene_type:complete
MKTTLLASLSVLLLAPVAFADDGPAGQEFTAVATRNTDFAREGQTATIRFEAGGDITVSGVMDAMGSDPWTSYWQAESNGEITNGASIFWMDPFGDRPTCRSWPDYPIGADIESVGGDWEATGVCWIGPEGGEGDWRITRTQ